MQHVKCYAKYMKIMLEVFELKYVDIENNLTIWKAKNMLKEVVIGDLTTFEMYKFSLDFKILDMSMWLNLSLEQASNLIEHMANNNAHKEKILNYKPNKSSNYITNKKWKEINGLISVYTITCKQVLSSWFFCLFSLCTTIVC